MELLQNAMSNEEVQYAFAVEENYAWDLKKAFYEDTKGYNSWETIRDHMHPSSIVKFIKTGSFR